EKYFDTRSYNQLWRNHLLAFSMLRQPTRYDEGYCAIVYPSEDQACTKAIAAYKPLLNELGAHTLLDWPLRTLVDTWANNLETPDEIAWLRTFRARYADTEASASAWQARKNKTGK